MGIQSDIPFHRRSPSWLRSRFCEATKLCPHQSENATFLVERTPYPHNAYQDDVFDVVFLVTVLGEVGNLPGCLHELRRVLRPGGVLSITEQLPDPDFISSKRLQWLIEPAGFLFV
ncbi:MAG: class I SAM-dependent methyltransferase, partial [Planctomycetota bacterium]